MFQVGDMIVYKTDGVCRVEAIGTPDMRYIDPDKSYYFLRHITRGGTTYVPVDSTVFMRPVINEETAYRIIDSIPGIEEEESEHKSVTAVTEDYRALLKSQECSDLVKLIKTAYSKKKAAAKLGRKPTKLDTQALDRAEELLHDELSVALGIDKEEVQPLIERRMRELEASGQAAV